MTKVEIPPLTDDTMIKVLFDVEELQPACVLIQSMAVHDMDGLFSSRVVHLFTNWVVNPSSPGLCYLTASWKEWKNFAEEVRRGVYEEPPSTPATESAPTDSAPEASRLRGRLRVVRSERQALRANEATDRC